MDYQIIDYTDLIIGEIFESNGYGSFKVLGATNKFSDLSHRLFCCEFFNPTYIGLYRKDHIISGNIKNPYYPSIYNVACIGGQTANHFLYSRWFQMIKRCYNTKSVDYKYYGGKGVRVCKEWLCFENYCNDVVNIPGYSYQGIINNTIELDKDYYGEKLYSPSTTIWLTVKNNKDLANQTQIDNLPLILGVSPDGEQFIFRNKSQFAIEHNLDRECISRCIKNKQKKHFGWSFKRMEDEDT